jgi:phosphatidylglycerophosphate synthase
VAELENRRPLKSRGAGWAKAAAAALARADANPDLISALSMVFAVLGASLFLWAGIAGDTLRVAALALAALTIQLRLVCNLLDGMVAVEHGRGSSAGPIWNELPDRIGDPLFLAAAGYCASLSGVHIAVLLGWLCAVGALITAYIRELGRALGFPADFSGPMAKPHRMALLTAATLVSVVEPLWRWRGESLAIGLGLMALGILITILRRVLTLSRRLAKRA